jgi:hypothetical protein
MSARSAALPIVFGSLGVGYFAATYIARPDASNIEARALWQRHAADAKIALVAGLGAAVVLWLARAPRERPRHSFY